ncbi:uromodulin-like [Pocillopora verrucosa]|uniref:uromodulin-like n=1 Tax=Pocillopora verrucosa TaxID=203993 RepID=UPI00333F0DEE
MWWLFRHLRFVLFTFTMEFVTANDQCRTEVNVQGMALKRSVFKRWSLAAPHLCDVKCGQEIACQSYNYNHYRNYQICELNNRTKEARPENFLSAPAWFYIRRLNGRAPLGSIPELPALSCHEIKASEGKYIISGMYWLDPTCKGKAKLIYCDMVHEDMDECKYNISNCDVNANCTNTYGSYKCTCKVGYTGDGHSCSDINECKGNHSCHVNATCMNTLGSHVCQCHAGYTGNGQSCTADPCYNYQNLSDANRKSSYVTPIHGPSLCDDLLPEGWYRFVGAAGTKMPTTRVPAFRCGTTWSGWLDSAHPTLQDGKVQKEVCFSDRSTGCKRKVLIYVKNCGSYFIYKLFGAFSCNSRYCGTD